jgi:hypothetical protein
MNKPTPKQAIESAASTLDAAAILVPEQHRWILGTAAAALDVAAEFIEPRPWDHDARTTQRNGLDDVLAQLPGFEPEDARHIARGVVASITVIRRWAGLEVE